MHPTIEWKDGRVVMIDQRRLPLEEVYVECADEEGVAQAIETMVIRGAPAIGVAAAYGVALGLLTPKPGQSLDGRLDEVVARLARTGSLEGTPRFPPRGNLARFEPSLSPSPCSGNRARSGSHTALFMTPVLAPSLMEGFARRAPRSG